MANGETAKIDIDAFFKAAIRSILGVWTKPFEAGVVGIHAALLHTNEVLFWTYRDDLGDHEHDHDAEGTFITVANGEWSLLSLSSGKQVVNKQIAVRNQFCGGQCLLGDGGVLVVGGDRDTPDNGRTVRVYNPATRIWKELPDLYSGRYYPTLVSIGGTLGFIVGGREATAGVSHYRNATAQFLNTTTGKPDVPIEFDDDLNALPDHVDPPGVSFPFTYPFVFVVPGARIFVHVGFKTRVLKLFKNFAFDAATKLNAVDKTSRNYPYQGTAVLLPLRPADNYRARIMLIGGGAPDFKQAKDSCEVLDLGASNPQWLPVQSMNHRRIMPDAVLLPDGTVFVTNGAEAGGLGSEQPVLEAEVYDPSSDSWTDLAPMTVERLYHSTALLLPDGRVLCAGTDRQWNALPHGSFKGFDYAHTTLEVFSPPYLFRGPRPKIRWSPQVTSFGEAFEVATDDAEAIKSAVLMRNGSCTHSFSSDQRFVELEIKQRMKDKLWVTWTELRVSAWGATFTLKWPSSLFVSKGVQLQAPPNGFIAPEAYYMLFLVSSSGVPSEANFIRVAEY